MGLRATWPLIDTPIRVWRNAIVETVISAAAPFAAFAGRRLQTALSSYDDALTFDVVAPGSSKVEILWIDQDRYPDLASGDLVNFLVARIMALRDRSEAPLIVALVGAGTGNDGVEQRVREALNGVPALLVAPVAALALDLSDEWVDKRLRKVTGGSSLSDRATIALGRELAFSWLPPLLEPRVKALAIDLDGTLHAGVLGEDGVHGIRTEEGHRALGAAISALAADGVLVGVVSRNELADVETMFAERGDLALERAAISALDVSWGPKAAAISRLAEQFHIDTGAFLFIDDNPGELAAAAAILPSLRTLHAADPNLTANALSRFPGLVGYSRRTEDALRARDLATSAEREAAAAADPTGYRRSLGMHLAVRLDAPSRLERAAELAVKTNQFNISLARTGAVALSRYMADPASRIATLTLSDRLSDSGVIAMALLRRDGAIGVIEELDISCRALGRGIDDALAGVPVLAAARDMGIDQIRFVRAVGPRNAPALAWLASLGPLAEAGEVIPLSMLSARVEALGTDIDISLEDDSDEA